MIDHFLEDAPELGHLLIADAPMLRMVLALHPAVPAAAGQVARNPVDRGVARLDFERTQRAANDQEAPEVEQVFVQRRGDGDAREIGLWAA